jgi:hypothetical protein
MVKICQTGFMKKRIFRLKSRNFLFANFQCLGPLGCPGWVVITLNMKKGKIPDVNGLEGGGKTLEHLDCHALAKGSALSHLSPQFPSQIKRSVVGPSFIVIKNVLVSRHYRYDWPDSGVIEGHCNC